MFSKAQSFLIMSVEKYKSIMILKFSSAKMTWLQLDKYFNELKHLIFIYHLINLSLTMKTIRNRRMFILSQYFCTFHRKISIC